MLIDSRDYLDADGWPVINERDRLPLLQLLEGCMVTSRFVAQIKACPSTKLGIRTAYELQQGRDAVCYELLLPSWWHCSPVRRFKCSNERGSPL